MAAERLRMRDIHYLFKLHFVEGKSQAQIAKTLGCGKTTVREYIYRANSAGLEKIQDIEGLSEADLLLKLGFRIQDETGSGVPRKSPTVMPDWQYIHTEKMKPNVTLMLLWTEYMSAVGEGAYGYTQFAEHYRRWQKKLSVTLRRSHKAGEKTFVDYCDGIFIFNERGENQPTQLFVGCLGASSYTYAELTMTQTLPDWISSHCRMWSYFGGVSEITVPDNLKSGVNIAHRYEPKINDSYQDMAQHYGTCIIPARSNKPRDKAKAEVAVLVAQRWILARLRNQVFYSLTEANEAIAGHLEFLNNRKMRHFQKSRYELYKELELSALLPLPKKPYEFAEWKEARVNIDYHITFDFHHYSVPYQLVHEIMNVRATSTVIEIYHRGKRIVSHVRGFIKNAHTTTPEHMPKSHREFTQWTPSRVIDWANSIGVFTGQLVEKIILQRKHPEQGFRAALGIIRLEKKYSKERLEKSCQRALEIGAISFHFVNESLKNKMEQTTVPSKQNESLAENKEISNLGSENIRGSQYYH